MLFFVFFTTHSQPRTGYNGVNMHDSTYDVQNLQDDLHDLATRVTIRIRVRFRP